MSTAPERLNQNSMETTTLKEIQNQQGIACISQHVEEDTFQSSCSDNDGTVTYNDWYVPEHSLDENNSNTRISEGKEQPQNTELECAETTTQSNPLQEIVKFTPANNVSPLDVNDFQQKASKITSSEFHQEGARSPYQETSYNSQLSSLQFKTQFTSDNLFPIIHSSYQISSNTFESIELHQPQETVSLFKSKETTSNTSNLSQNEIKNPLNSFSHLTLESSQYITSKKSFVDFRQELTSKPCNDGNTVIKLECLQNEAELNFVDYSLPSSTSPIEIQSKAFPMSVKSENIYFDLKVLPLKKYDENQELTHDNCDILSKFDKTEKTAIKKRKCKQFDKKRQKLIDFYDIQDYPSTEEMLVLADTTELTYSQVRRWFQARRRSRKQRLSSCLKERVSNFITKSGRKLYKSSQIQKLIEFYDKQPYPSMGEMSELADDAELDSDQVRRWFKNRRSRNISQWHWEDVRKSKTRWESDHYRLAETLS